MYSYLIINIGLLLLCVGAATFTIHMLIKKEMELTAKNLLTAGGWTVLTIGSLCGIISQLAGGM